MHTLIIHSDGGSRGNPGPAAIGVHAELDNKRIFELSKTIGVATNNTAEYQAVVQGMQWLQSYVLPFPTDELAAEWLVDSKLVAEQLSGRYKIKNISIAGYTREIWDICAKLPYTITFRHIPREQNAEADMLVNAALDA